MMTMLSPEPPYNLSLGRSKKGTASTTINVTAPLTALAHPWACLSAGDSAVVIGRHEHHVGGCDDGALAPLGGVRRARVELMDAEKLGARAKTVLGDLAEVGAAFELSGDGVGVRSAVRFRQRKAFRAQRHPHGRPRVHNEARSSIRHE